MYTVLNFIFLKCSKAEKYIPLPIYVYKIVLEVTKSLRLEYFTFPALHRIKS